MIKPDFAEIWLSSIEQIKELTAMVYSIEILEILIYRRACAAEGVIIPINGLKLIKHGDRELTVDYGYGTCDNVVILTNGRSYRYEVKN